MTASAAILGSVLGATLGPLAEREAARHDPLTVRNHLLAPVLVKIEGEAGRGKRSSVVIEGRAVDPAADGVREGGIPEASIPIADSPVGVYAEVLNLRGEDGSPAGDAIELFLNAYEGGSTVDITASVAGRRIWLPVVTVAGRDPTQWLQCEWLANEDVQPRVSGSSGSFGRQAPQQVAVAYFWLEGRSGIHVFCDDGEPRSASSGTHIEHLVNEETGVFEFTKAFPSEFVGKGTLESHLVADGT